MEVSQYSHAKATNSYNLFFLQNKINFGFVEVDEEADTNEFDGGAAADPGGDTMVSFRQDPSTLNR